MAGQTRSSRDDIYAEIAGNLTDSKVFFSEPMANHTSFRIGGPCDLLVIPKTENDAIKAWSMCRNLNVPYYVVGNCTNLLVKDGGFRGCIIKLSPGFTGVSRSNETLTILSGSLLKEALQASVRFRLSGLEFAAGIPGSIGGAVTMNAGAYGRDIGSLVKRVEVATLNDEKHWLPASSLDFSYRHSLFSGRGDLLILSVELVLTPGDPDEIRRTVEQYLRDRQAKQPLDLPSAGSIFKRPQGRYVGEMIEMLGLKGLSCGGAMISRKHAGFIVNTGNATALDVLTLMEIVQKKVYEEFGVMLEPEIVVIGED